MAARTVSGTDRATQRHRDDPGDVHGRCLTPSVLGYRGRATVVGVTGPVFTDQMRRNRLARRHRLHPEHRATDPVDAARAVVALHATDPGGHHLSAIARCADATPGDVDRALYEDRALVRQMAMRGTLFSWPAESYRAAVDGPGRRAAVKVEAQLRRSTADRGDGWLDEAATAVLAHIRERGPSTATEVREARPDLFAAIEVGSGRWVQQVSPVAQLLTLLSLRGDVVRCGNRGPWTRSRPVWELAGRWLGEHALGRLSEREANAALARAYIERFGPITEADLRWWFRATAGAARQMIADAGAVPCALMDGSGWVVDGDGPGPDDEPVGDWVTLTGVLDPTVMGWRGRGHYLDPAGAAWLFDTVGNAGHIVFVNGHASGTWVQAPDGTVAAHLHPDRTLTRGQRDLLLAECQRLTRLLDGTVASTVWVSVAMNEANPALKFSARGR